MITAEQILRWLELMAEALEEKKDYLTELDAAIGDADHGTNMSRGFQKVQGQLSTLAGKDISSILKAAGMALISNVGGASGPLYGTFFLRAAAAAAGKHELQAGDLATLLQEGVEGIGQRGKAQVGDKTLVDALAPAAETFQQALNKGSDTLTALGQAVKAAEKGMKDTIPLVARKGRASYLGERSRGHQDPGATSAFILLETLLRAVEENRK